MDLKLRYEQTEVTSWPASDGTHWTALLGLQSLPTCPRQATDIE
jgi:hypothetical protein